MKLPSIFHVVLLALIAVFQGCSGGAGSSDNLQATVLPEPMPLPQFSLLDHEGGEFSRDSLLGRWSLLFFGFTHCPDICPATLQQLAAARLKLANTRPDAALPTIVLVSVDPERDSAEILNDYVSYFGEDIIGVTGMPDELKTLTAALGIFFQKDPGDSSNYNVSHSTAVVLINPDAGFHAVLGSPLDIDAIVHDLPIVMAKK